MIEKTLKTEGKKIQVDLTLKQLAKYLKVVHGFELDFDERTCDAELYYYACNLHDDVLYDAWKRYDKERSKGSRAFKQHFDQFRANLRYRHSTMRPFYAVAKSIETNFRRRLRDEKVHVDWF